MSTTQIEYDTKRSSFDLFQIAFERQQKDNELIQARHQKMQIDLETQIGTCNELNTENQTKALELKVYIYTRMHTCILTYIH